MCAIEMNFQTRMFQQIFRQMDDELQSTENIVCQKKNRKKWEKKSYTSGSASQTHDTDKEQIDSTNQKCQS